MIIRSLILFVLFAFYSAPQKNAVKLFAEKYASLHSVYARFSAEFTGGNLPMPSGDFYFKKPKSVKLSVKNNVILTDGEMIKTYNSRLNRVVISYSDEDESPMKIAELFSVLLKSENIKQLKGVKSGYGFFINNIGFENVDSVKFFTDGDFNLKKIVVFQSDKNILKIKFDKFELNPPGIDKALRFNYPKDAKVVDLR